MELGLDTPTLSRISLKYQENPDLALMEAVRQWFKKTDNPQLLDTLEQGINCACNYDYIIMAWVSRGIILISWTVGPSS